jgi:hypothetical protein
MFSRLGLAALAVLGFAGIALAQPPAPAEQAPVPTPMPTAGAVIGPSGCANCNGGACAGCDQAPLPAYHVWADAELLWWWLKPQRVPPLVTTSPDGTPREQAGVLGTPGTSVLFPAGQLNDDARFGGRVDLGFWFDHDQHFGLETNFFMLSAKGTTFDSSSNGSPILARPLLDATNNNTPGSQLVAFPGLATGSVQASASTGNLLGTEVLLRENLGQGACYRFDFVGGYRYLHYSDRVGVSESLISTDVTSPIVVGTNIAASDSFQASNDFHAFEWGFEGELRSGRWLLGGLVKAAVGYDNRNVTINGSTTVTVPGSAPITNTGGLLALSSNIGSHNSGQWTVVPEFGGWLGFQATEHTRVFVGYSLLYWPRIARAGEQIDLSVNPSLIIPLQATSGPQNPNFTLHTGSLWAQGIDLGIEFRF